MARPAGRRRHLSEGMGESWSGKRRKEGLLTLDHGSCLDLSRHKSGAALWELAVELRNVFASLPRTILTQAAH